MLVFGPYRAIPKDGNFAVFNLSSQNQTIPRLPGLFVDTGGKIPMYDDGQVEKSFDMWYYDYVLEDPVACSSLMSILSTLYDGHPVYVCIADYMNDSYISTINESFMKLIQSRYDIMYSIINDPEDLLYISQDGCDFMSVRGIEQFDIDRNRYYQLSEEQRLMYGGIPNEQ